MIGTVLQPREETTMDLKFHQVRPIDNGWYLVQTPEGLKPFDIVLFDDDKYFTIANREVIPFREEISAWSKIVHPDSHEWLDLEDLMILLDIAKMTHLSTTKPTLA